MIQHNNILEIPSIYYEPSTEIPLVSKGKIHYVNEPISIPHCNDYRILCSLKTECQLTVFYSSTLLTIKSSECVKAITTANILRMHYSPFSSLCNRKWYDTSATTSIYTSYAKVFIGFSSPNFTHLK